ncbi:MAG: glycosyltransferase family 9 protein [Kiritimatiellae bacterium]|nr:glycosyltransferase family 9 protein [Kiritimatiellia bacterium]
MPSIRLCVLRGGAVGDFMLTLPALALLRKRWPNSHIELVAYPRTAQLAVAAGLADHVTSLDSAGMASFFAARPALSKAQTEFVRGFDVIISYLYDPDGVLRANLLAAGARQVLGLYDLPDTGTNPRDIPAGHAIEHLMKPLAPLAIYPEAGPPLTLLLNESCRAAGLHALGARGIAGPWLAIHPGSGSARKNWPPEMFAQVADRIPNALPACRPVLIFGEADGQPAQNLQRLLPRTVSLSGLDLLTLASALTHCAGYLGNDSGVTHLAAMLGVPVVALFGPTDPDVWGPRGRRVCILKSAERRADGLKEIAVDQVLNALVRIAARPS